jgi:hypothetical protein
VRRNLLPFADSVNRKLDACGFPLCKGGIMAGNPEWCLSLEEWRGKFARWIQTPEPKALLNASIFFDFRPLYGDEELSHSLREWLLDASGKATLFLRLMTENALQCQPPLGMIRDFTYDNNKDFPHTIDLKMHGSRPFVDAARIFALANDVAVTSTAQRLRGAAEATNLGADVEAMIDGFYFIQLLRLRHQQDLKGDGRRRQPHRSRRAQRARPAHPQGSLQAGAQAAGQAAAGLPAIGGRKSRSAQHGGMADQKLPPVAAKRRSRSWIRRGPSSSKMRCRGISKGGPAQVRARTFEWSRETSGTATE